MLRGILIFLFFVAWASSAHAQNNIFPTVPCSNSSNQAATTAYVNNCAASGDNAMVQLPTCSIASAATISIDQDPSCGVAVNITGTTTISSFGAAQRAGDVKFLTVTGGPLTVAYNATSLITPTGSDLDIPTNGTMMAVSLGGSNWQVYLTSVTGLNTIPLPVGSGGTNATSQTTNGVAYFNGTGLVTGGALTFSANTFVLNTANTGQSTLFSVANLGTSSNANTIAGVGMQLACDDCAGVAQINGGTTPYMLLASENGLTGGLEFFADAGNINFLTAMGTAETLYQDLGVTIGSPTGGDKGAGTLNIAGGLFVNSSLFEVNSSGAITSGVWNGTTIAVGYGGTGQNSLTDNAFLTGNGTSGVNQVPITGLVLGNGSSAPTSYAGANCTTNKFVEQVSANGVLTCGAALVPSNNLSDVSNAATAFANLGTAQSYTGTGTQPAMTATEADWTASSPAAAIVIPLPASPSTRDCRTFINNTGQTTYALEVSGNGKNIGPGSETTAGFFGPGAVKFCYAPSAGYWSQSL